MGNPFLNTTYDSPLTFCDRKQEIEDLRDAIESGRSITLHSIRRMGKTGLIKHFFHLLRSNADSYTTIFVDIFHTEDSAGFVNALASAIAAHYAQKSNSWFAKFSKYLGHFRPRLTIHPNSGMPSLELFVETPQETRSSIEILFKILAEEQKTVVIAIDEFQQIHQYPSASLSAVLRNYMQSNSNFRFIFSGSRKHMLLDLFATPKKVLFGTTQFLALSEIDHDAYAAFIQFHFKQGLRKIDVGLIDDILHWTRRHTYYTQTFCQRLYANFPAAINEENIQSLKEKLLKEQEDIFIQYRKLLSPAQWKLLVAIGKAENAIMVSGKTFASKYNLGASSTINQSLKTLLNHEMVYEYASDIKAKPVYRVYDTFLTRWLETY